MVDTSDWKEMKRAAFEAYAHDGMMGVGELEKIVDIGLADGEFDEQEAEPPGGSFTIHSSATAARPFRWCVSK